MIVADTSALVSLAAGEALDLVLDEFDVATTETVVEELDAMAGYDDGSGAAVQMVLDRCERLSVREIEPPAIGSDRVDDGEASCVALAREADTDFLITEDFRALPEIRPLTDARVAISPVVLRALVKRGRLDSTDARDRLDDIAERRSWLGAPIYRRACDLFRD